MASPVDHDAGKKAGKYTVSNFRVTNALNGVPVTGRFYEIRPDEDIYFLFCNSANVVATNGIFLKGGEYFYGPRHSATNVMATTKGVAGYVSVVKRI